MYLHKNKVDFKDLIELVSNSTGRPGAVVEKDYYVTLILKQLAEQMENCVFKGGTSLSKGFHAINRFSEDIDITFSEHLGESRRKKLKNVVLKGISERMKMPISNWDVIQSDRDYNAYLFSYDSVYGFEDDRMMQTVKLETALGSYAFPTESVMISNYIGDYLEARGRTDIANQYDLNKFSMKLQSLERTYIDKIFALCDYYMQNRSKRCSRHLYDVFKLTPLINFNDDFIVLCKAVREHRSKMKICPSAQSNKDVGKLIMEFCDTNFYEEDYKSITSYFAEDNILYSDAVAQVRKLAELF